MLCAYTFKKVHFLGRVSLIKVSGCGVAVEEIGKVVLCDTIKQSFLEKKSPDQICVLENFNNEKIPCSGEILGIEFLCEQKVQLPSVCRVRQAYG